MAVAALRQSEEPLTIRCVFLLTACLVLLPPTTPIMTGEETQNSAAQQWRELANAPDFFHEMSLLQSLGQDLHERAAVLSRPHKMWASYDALRRPEIAYLMCQLGDPSGVEAVAKAFFADDYDTGRRLEPDGGAAGANATDDAFRMLILYGTPQHHQRLLAFLRLSDDPLRKRDNLCEALLGLSSINNGPGLPRGYPREQFPLELQGAIPARARHRLPGLYGGSRDDSFCARWHSAVAEGRAAGLNYGVRHSRRVHAAGL